MSCLLRRCSRQAGPNAPTLQTCQMPTSSLRMCPTRAANMAKPPR